MILAIVRVPSVAEAVDMELEVAEIEVMEAA